MGCKFSRIQPPDLFRKRIGSHCGWKGGVFGFSQVAGISLLHGGLCVAALVVVDLVVVVAVCSDFVGMDAFLLT